MGKKPMSIKNLLNRPYYRGIIFLLRNFQYQKDKNGEIKTIGLRQLHFRYALMKEPNINESIENKIKDFFAEKTVTTPKKGRITLLRLLQSSGHITKGSVKSPQKLSNYLDHLVKIDIIERYGKRPNVRYTLTDKYFEDMDKSKIISEIERWHYPEIISEKNLYESIDNPNGFQPEIIEHTNISDYYDIPTTRWFLCGFSTELLKNLNSNEKKKLNRCLTTIEKNLWEIMELKYAKTKTSREKQIKELLKKNKETPFPHTERLGFYYNAKKLIAIKTYKKQ